MSGLLPASMRRHSGHTPQESPLMRLLQLRYAMNALASCIFPMPAGPDMSIEWGIFFESTISRKALTASGFPIVSAKRILLLISQTLVCLVIKCKFTKKNSNCEILRR